MNRSTAAFLIALLLHLLIFALFIILGMIIPTPQKADQPREQRMRVSLKEYPKAKKDALVKNDNIQPAVTPPMPKGSQLQQLPSQAPSEPAPRPTEQPLPPKKSEPSVAPEKPQPTVTKPPRVTPSPKPSPRPLPVPKVAETPETPMEPQETAKETPTQRLYNKLSTPTLSTASAEPKPKLSQEKMRHFTNDLKEAYGDTFAQLSAGEQKYILDNAEIMRRVTQEVLNRVASVSIPRELRVNDYNLIEFYLHPNGDISDVRLLRRSGFYKLDDTTVETIQYAYSRYPRPQQKTLIRFKFGYYLRGY